VEKAAAAVLISLLGLIGLSILYWAESAREPVVTASYTLIAWGLTPRETTLCP
jgi:hypothetical protein